MDTVDKYLEELYLDEFIILPTIALGTMIYKKHLSKSAQACANYTGKEKERCIIAYKIKGRREQIKQIKKAVPQCKEDKNPIKCKEKALKEAQKVFEKMRDLIEKFKTIQNKSGVKT